MCRMVEKWSSIFTIKVRLDRNYFIILISRRGSFILNILWRRPSYQTRSKAFSTSRKTEAVCRLLLKLMISLSIKLISCWAVEWPLRKTNCSSRILPLRFNIREIKIIFSNIPFRHYKTSLFILCPVLLYLSEAYLVGHPITSSIT